MKNWKVEDGELIIAVPNLLKVTEHLTHPLPKKISHCKTWGPNFTTIGIDVLHLELVKQAIESYMENQNE